MSCSAKGYIIWVCSRNLDLAHQCRFTLFSKTGLDTQMGSLVSWDLLDFYMEYLLAHFRNLDVELDHVLSLLLTIEKTNACSNLKQS